MHPRGEFDGIAQRELKHGDYELDPTRHRRERRQHLERVQGGSAAANRITDPDARKFSGFYLAGEIDDAIHQRIMAVRPILL